MNKELLNKYCNNSCTETELLNVLEWFRESSLTSEGKSMLFKIWEDTNEGEVSSEINFNQILDRIHHKVNLSQSKATLLTTSNNLGGKKGVGFLMIISRVAAILLLPVLVFGLYMYYSYKSEKQLLSSFDESYNEVFSSSDAITKVTLMDGSNVWLNHNSSLKYPSVFNGDDRRVELNGEGYFEVASNSKKPFIVKADELEIKAIGTTFNIMSFPEEDMIETSLIDGVVQLQRIDSEGNIIPLLNMKPTDLAAFNKESKKITVRDVNDDRYFSWKEGKLIFNREPMGEVARKLSRWFNVDIEIRDAELLELTYTATFVNETLPQVMELLAMMSPVSYSISNRVQISDGVFAKRKVIINYNKK
jgi:transmembrane sensor